MTSPTQEYREIPLTRGMVAIVDKDDFDFLAAMRWKAVFDRHTGGYYANRSHSKGELMHRVILGLQRGDGKMVDHINGNALDNRRVNLRIATNRQNQHNRRLGKDNISGYKGVSWSKAAKKWRATIRHEGKCLHLGTYTDPKKAHLAYCEAAKHYHGEFARFS